MKWNIKRKVLSGDNMKNIDEKDIIYENIWRGFADIPIDENENIEIDFAYWKAGTNRMEIWHDIDENHSKGIGWLMENIE